MSTVTLNARLVVADGVLSKEIDGETVLLNLKSGVYFGLDALSTDMWRILQAGSSLSEAASTIEGDYEVEPETVRADLLRFVNELIEKGLVRIA